jgi:hypothetical protein
MRFRFDEDAQVTSQFDVSLLYLSSNSAIIMWTDHDEFLFIEVGAYNFKLAIVFPVVTSFNISSKVSITNRPGRHYQQTSRIKKKGITSRHHSEEK